MAATAEQLTTLIHKHGGNVSAVARSLRVSRSTVYDRINENSALKLALNDARETFVDEAESQLRKKVKKGDVTAIIFTLKSLGKHRGWVERQETEQVGPIKVIVEYADA